VKQTGSGTAQIMGRLTIFLCLLLINAGLLVIGWFAFAAGVAEVMIAASLPVTWLLFAMQVAGLTVTAGGGMLQAPNTLGVVALVVGTVISLLLYYYLAGWISRTFIKNKEL